MMSDYIEKLKNFLAFGKFFKGHSQIGVVCLKTRYVRFMMFFVLKGLIVIVG